MVAHRLDQVTRMPGVLVTSRYVEPLATCALPAPEHGMHSILVPLATAITEVPVLRQVEPRRDFPGVLAHGQVVNHRDDPQPLQFGSPCSSAALGVRPHAGHRARRAQQRCGGGACRAGTSKPPARIGTIRAT